MKNEEFIYVGQTLGEVARLLAFAFRHPGITPGEVGALLTGSFLAPFLNEFCDEHWRDIKRVAFLPCGEEGCDCHVEKRILFEALDVVRDKSGEFAAKMKT